MAAAFLLVLVAVGAARAAVPEPCQGGPTSWCQDMATAARCRKEQYCRDLWDSLALWDVAEGDVAEVEVMAQGKGKKCQECIGIVKKVKDVAGDDPDDAAVGKALDKVCRARRKGRSRTCKGLVKRYRDQISSSLQNGDEPQDTCAAIGFC